LTVQAAALLALIAIARPLAAQTPDETVANASVKLGPLALTPVLAVTDVGYDSNVFYTTPSQGDFTATVAPQADLWLRMGRSWLTGRVKEDFVYFHEFSGERSANGRYAAGWFMPFNRVTVTADASYLNTRERQGFDIDARSRRIEREVGGALAFVASSKTSLSVLGHRQTVSYDQSAVYAGSSLSQELDRTSTTAGVNVRHAVTPLTSVSLEVSRTRDRFEFSPLRDSDSTRVMAGIQLDASALIHGSGSFGYRRFVPLSAGVPGFDGVNWTADLEYTALVWTRLSFQATRDIQYSYDATQPYYVQTGFSGAWGQQIHGPVGVTLRGGLQHLDYQSLSPVLIGDSADTVHTVGGGVEYRLGKDTKLFFNVDRQQRSSRDLAREYSGVKCTTSFTYQF